MAAPAGGMGASRTQAPGRSLFSAKIMILPEKRLAAGKATPASRCYSPGRGLVTVAAAGGIERVAVYSLGGAKVADHALHGAAYATLAAGPGGCIVVVETTGGKQETHKLQVR